MIRIGCYVSHQYEPDLGIGRVVALSPVNNVVLVVWRTGVQRHDLRVVRRANV